MSSNNTADRRAKLSEVKQALLRKRLQDQLKSAQLQQIKPRPSQKATVLSFAQRRIWFLQQLDPDSAAYNIHAAVWLSGPLNLAAMEQSLNEVIKRHEILRTVFSTAEDLQPVQVIGSTQALDLPVVDLKGVDKSKQSELIRQVTIQAAQEPFDLLKGPLLRTELLQLEAHEHVMILILHHIISDEWSDELFWKELGTFYKSFVDKTPPSLPQLPIQYADYAYWQNQWLQEATYQKQLAYWKQRLQGDLPLLQLPTDGPRPSPQSSAGALQSVMLSPAVINGLKQISQQAETTMFMTVLAAFGLLLHRYSGQRDIIIGIPIANRNRPELKDLIGVFLNTLALRLNFEANSSFQTLLAQVRQIALDAFANQETPFEKLVDELHPERFAGHNPIFQVMFVYQNKSSHPAEFPSLEVRPVPLVDSGTAKFDLTLFAIESEGALEAAIEYSTDLFEAETITRMLGHFHTLLEGIVANPQQSISTLPILTRPERDQLLVEWNQTQTDFPPEVCIHELIEAHAENTPDTIALKFGNEGMNYATLDQHAEILAGHLQSRGVGPNVLVAVCMERSLDMFVSILGVLKAGGGYVPLDPSYPTERLSFVLDDTQSPVLLTQASLLPQLPNSQAEIVCVDRDWTTIAGADRSTLIRQNTTDDLAYVIYTSGSTGQPKGVPISHRNLVHSTTTRSRYYPESIESFLLLSSFAFDSSLVGIFGTLCQGGTLILPPQDGEQDVGLVASLIAQHQVSHLLSLPSLYDLLLTYAQADQLNSLRAVIVAGEACPKNLVEQHYQDLPGTALYNEYGPTEGTVWSTVYRVPADDGHPQVSIGRPIANMQTYILDAQRQPLPIGVPGELYIGGPGLAPGYLNRPHLTTEKFVPHPFSEDPTARLYRTGDLVRYLPDGNIDFLGRVDNQVKIRGYRIELDEIENWLKQQSTVHEAVVVVREFGSDKRLVGYIVPSGEPPPSPAELQSALRTNLPEYMIPPIFITLEMIPRTPNGKVDRRALPDPELTPAENIETTAPHSETEKTVAHLWQELLGVPRIGLHDNFFDLGGHSLLVTQLVARLRNTFQISLALNTVFEKPTVFALAEHIDTLLWATQSFDSTRSDTYDEDVWEEFEI